MVCLEKALRYETPTPSPLAGAGNLSADGSCEAFYGLCNWLLAFLLAWHLQAGTRCHGIGQRAEDGCGWKSLLARLANGSGQGLAHLLGAPGRRRGSSPNQVVVARRDESGRTALLAASASEDGASGRSWELRGNALPVSVRSRRSAWSGKRRQNIGKSVLVGLFPSMPAGLCRSVHRNSSGGKNRI
jgi:hypothetical protein